MVYCLICGEEFKAITNTHLFQHGLTIEEYINEFDIKKTEWQSKKQIEAALIEKPQVKIMNKTHRKLIAQGKAYVQSDKSREKTSIRMSLNNPMFNPKTVNKTINSLIEKYKHEDHPNKGNKRPDFSNWLRKNNPMFDKEYASLVLHRSKQTLIKNGNISKGQQRLYDLLDSLTIYGQYNFKYRKEYPILSYFMDAAIPEFKVGIEYDGINTHYSSNYDIIRDIEIIDMGWRILRFDTNAIFTNTAVNDIMRFTESSEVRKCVGKKYSQ